MYGSNYSGPCSRTPSYPPPRPFCLECLTRCCRHSEDIPPRLRERDIELLLLLCDGCDNKQIASVTGLTKGTVSIYLGLLYRKLRLTNRLEAAMWATHHLAALKE